MNKVVEDQARVGIGSWAGGHQYLMNLITTRLYDYSFTQNGDFNVATVEFPAMPELLQNGELDVASTAPLLPNAAGPILVDDPPSLVPFVSFPSMMEEMGFRPDSIPLGNIVSKRSYTDEHSSAIEALLKAWKEGVTKLHSDPYSFLELEDAMSKIGASNEAAAKAMIDFAIGEANRMDGDVPAIPQRYTYTDDFIQTDKEVLGYISNNIEDYGNWDERLRYVKHDL